MKVELFQNKNKTVTKGTISPILNRCLLQRCLKALVCGTGLKMVDILQGKQKDDEPPPPPHRTSSLSPSKRQQPPPPPPRRSYPTDWEDEENVSLTKTKKVENKHDNLSPVKPPRIGLTDMNRHLNEDGTKRMSENNNPVHDELDDDERMESDTQESNTSHLDTNRG